MLGTERLTLTPLTPLTPLTEDVATIDFLFALDSDPEVMRYLTGGRANTRGEVIAAACAATTHRWIVSITATNERIGWAGIRPGVTDPNDRELGYRFLHESWGHGYATEASIALVNYAFGALGAHRVWAGTMMVNIRSQHVMQRCGLTHYRRFFDAYPDPIAGAEHGDVEYEITRARWISVNGGQADP